MRRLIPCDLESDERFCWLRRGCRDCHDLARITGRRSRSVRDDGAILGDPISQISAELSHNSEGGIVSDIEGVGKSVS